MPKIISPDTATVIAQMPARLKRRVRSNSFGIRLFSMIMGGAAVSIASVAFLFAETVKYQAEDQIQKVLVSKVSTIHEVTDRAENLAYTLGVSVATLHIRRAQTAETYQILTRQLFESQPSYVLGLGFGQKEYGILTDRDWFYPYYQVDPTDDDQLRTSSVVPLPTTAQAGSVRYINRAEDGDFYPTSEPYQAYFLPQKSVWTSPYQRDGDTLLTYYSQILDDDQTWLGTAVIDIDGDYLQAVLDEPVFRQGGKLVLLSEEGRVIADPAADAGRQSAGEGVGEGASDRTYADVAGLSEVWSQIEGESSSGLIEGEGGYWSYIQIPEQSWVVLAYVPYRVVFGRIVAIALASTLLAGLLMAGLTALAIRYLNRRLRPVIDECQRLSLDDDEITQKLVGKDELAQLSISFFNLLEQLQLTQTQVKLEAAHASEVEEQLKQIKSRTAATQRRQQRVTQKLADILPLVADTQANLANSETDLETISARRLQQDLAQLNETISTLATDDWLLGTLSDRKGELLPAAEMSELTQVSTRLGHTFLQVLSALNQFSQLLGAFGMTYEHVLTIEQKMSAAEQDVEAQTAVVSQLQQWATGHEMFCHQLAQTTNQPIDAVVTTEPSDDQERLALVAPKMSAFRETAAQLQTQMRSLFAAIEDIDHKNRQYQRINTAAQVLIMNASTLSISASRQQDPEAFEAIVTQLHSKKRELQTLAQQLETAQARPSQAALPIEDLSDKLRSTMDIFDQVAQALDESAASLASSRPSSQRPSSQRPSSQRPSSQLSSQRPQQPSASASSSAAPFSEQTQQLAQQFESLRRSLQEIESLTMATAQSISSALQETSQVRETVTELPLALPSR